MAVVYGDPTRYYGTMTGFVIYDAASICRTADILVANPTWEEIDTGISGTILDVQCVALEDNSVGAWCLTDTAVYWCADIEATTPSWTSKLAIATVQASDATPTTGSVAFKCMAAHPTVDGYLIVATGPGASDGDNTDYAHAYTWHTHDYGSNWTQDDMTAFLLLTSSGPDVYRGYCYSSVQACEIAEDGTIYLARVAPVTGVGSSSYVFKSSDLGDTWSQGAQLPSLTNNRQSFSLSAPDTTGVGYAVQGTIGVSGRPDLHHTDDSWASTTERTTPAGYGGVIQSDYRVARIYGDVDHVRTWYRETSTEEHHLLASDDQGVNWSILWEAIPNSTGIVYNPPINWPPDPLLWIVIANDPPSGDIDNVVLTTADDFANRTDRTGNLEALLGTWATGYCGGFPIPKVALPLSGYAVADGYNQNVPDLVALDPQPKSAGVKVTRRVHSGNRTILDQALYVELEWDIFETAAQYQGVLTALGILDDTTNQITISARNQEFTWKRYNGIAVRPEIGNDGQWDNYLPRNFKVLVKFLDEIVD